jgi:ACT domain-containing protein
MQTPQYLTEKEVEELTGIKVSTLQNHRNLKIGIPYVKIGAMVRYNFDDVVDTMDSHRIAA